MVQNSACGHEKEVLNDYRFLSGYKRGFEESPQHKEASHNCSKSYQQLLLPGWCETNLAKVPAAAMFAPVE
jgi:hypothetical protein